MISLIFALVLSAFTSAYAAGPDVSLRNAEGRAKSVCSARELKGQDCRLSAGSFHVRLLADTIARDDGLWHTVDPMPLKGPGVEWEKVNFAIERGIPILQFWLWDKGGGEASVQNLQWFVTDLRKGELKVLGQGIVRRRRLKPSDDPKAPPAFIYDGWETHSFKAVKNGFEWTLGTTKKTVEP